MTLFFYFFLGAIFSISNLEKCVAPKKKKKKCGPAFPGVPLCPDTMSFNRAKSTCPVSPIAYRSPAHHAPLPNSGTPDPNRTHSSHETIHPHFDRSATFSCRNSQLPAHTLHTRVTQPTHPSTLTHPVTQPCTVDLYVLLFVVCIGHHRVRQYRTLP